MADWQDISSAPKDRAILVYGKPTDTDEVHFTAPGVHAAYWDPIDSSFCLKGATWLGPFIKPLCWMEEPAAPEMVPVLTTHSKAAQT
jgi:hypothetical protein